MGEVFAVPYARLEPWPAGADPGPGGRLHGAGPDPGAGRRADPDPDRRAAGPAALLLGAEGAGLTAAAMAASDVRVVIPMRRGVDSLNVAAATAVAAWELGRDDPV